MTIARFTLALALVSLGIGACSDDGGPIADEDAGPIPGRRDVGQPASDVDGSTDGGGDVGVAPDAERDAALDAIPEAGDDAPGGADAREDVPTNPCDRDDDDHLAYSCGGDDCNDDDLRISPSVREICDTIDQDCSGEVNDGINCTFYAHTANQLYEIDPFQRTETFVTSAPNLFDFDTDTDGNLWGISATTLYRFDTGTRDWVSEASLVGFSASPNGFAIDSRSAAYATAGNDLYGIDLDDGSWERIGSMGGGFRSSGDCVVDKNDILYMTSKHESGHDSLIRIDSGTGVGVEVGDIEAADGESFSSIFGLTAAWGYLFGVSSSGDLIEIDPDTGDATLLHTFAGRVWYGAASTAGR